VKSLAAGLSNDPESASSSSEELQDAEEELQAAERSGKLSGGAWWAAFWQTASLIFVAEWGDRSMLATIALAIKSNPVGVATGATLGHAVATLLAVSIGSMASKYISEKVVQIIGGVLFLAFALETGLGLGIL
jgi:putative Ca2+/H+ antiporter (TMEM165/GDT1 family)